MTQALIDNLPLIAGAPDGIKALRGLILDLAVQGKLVPQDLDDEPASKLLERIRAEKARLVRAGTIRREKPLPPIAESKKLFDLPPKWEWVRAGEICLSITDGDHFPPPKADTGVPFLVIGDVRDGQINPALASRRVPEAYFAELDWIRKPIYGDVLLTTVGSYGIPVLVKTEERFCFQRHIALLRPGVQDIQGWIFSAFRSQFLFNQMTAIATGIAQKTVPLSGLRMALIPLPPIAEQRRIVTKVDELMALCDQLEAQQADAGAVHTILVKTLLDALTQSQGPDDFAANWKRLSQHFPNIFFTEASVDALKQTILHLAVAGKLVPQFTSDEPAGEMLKRIAAKRMIRGANGRQRGAPASEVSERFAPPPGWAWCHFFDVAEIRSELVRPEDYEDNVQVAPDCIEKGTGKLTMKRTVKESGVRGPNARFYAGQVLYSKIRPSLSKAVIVNFDGLCSADMYPLDAFILPEFLLSLILSPYFLDQVRDAENRVKMPKLNRESLAQFTVCVPPLAEQHRIVSKVSELWTLCDTLKAQIVESRAVQSQLTAALVEQTLAA